MMHMGEPGYFRAMSHFVRDAELLLAEGAGGMLPGKRLKDEEIPELGLWIRRSHRATAGLLGLELQTQWDGSVVTDRWKLADLNRDEMEAGAADIRLPEQFKQQVLRQEKALASASESDRARAKEEAYKDLLAEIRGMDRRARARAGSGMGMSDFNKRREKRMWDVIARHLKSGEHKRVALLFGAWHSHILEPRLVNELGFKLHATWWQDAVTYEEP
jgi:hypothetical protein